MNRAQLPVYDLGNGRIFSAEEKIIPDTIPPPIGLDTDDKIRAFVSDLWAKNVRAIQPEHDRMKRCQLYYDGFHYTNPIENFEKEITNYPYSVVETIWPEMVEQKPRPEIQPGAGVSEANADTLQEFATWLMNTTAFDRTFRLCTREKLKLGWAPNLIVFDPRTGMPYAKPWCSFDYYPDFAGAHEDSMQYYFLAGPVPTRWLQSQFPHRRESIVPDNWVSPSYDVLVRPWDEMQRMASDAYGGSGNMVGYAAQDRGFANFSSETALPGSTFLTNPAASLRNEYAYTTFLLQLFFRDMTHMMVTYRGKIHDTSTGGWHWAHQSVPEPVCQSEWRVIQMTANGTLLDIAQQDPCYGGTPITIGRDVEQAHRFFATGEIDPIIPKTRAYNRRLDMLNRALEYQCAPVLVADPGTGIDVNRAAVEAGEILRKRDRGSQVSWLEIKGPVEQQFALLQSERQDIDVISGVHDVQQGQRPPGIETGIAIERLQMAASKRIRGKEATAHDEWAITVKKLMVSAGLKLNRRIMFRGTGGKQITMDPEVLLNEYGLGFAPGSGLMATREAKKNEAFTLYQAGAIDEEELLKAFDWKDREAVLQRMMLRRQQELMVAAAQAQTAGTNGGSNGGGKSKSRVAA